MLSTLPNARISLPKRTRVNVSQSKNGCFTCRARRIKCDEAKPTCSRCQRSGKLCEGYGSLDRTVPWFEASYPRKTPQKEICLIESCPSIAIANHLSLHLETDAQSKRYLHLGSEVLLQDLYGTFLLNGSSVCVNLIPQFSLLNHAVLRAIATFGAAYEAVFILRSQHSLLQASAQYVRALAALRDDIIARTQGLIPAFLASIMLAAAQVLLQHYSDCLAHLGGAFAVLTQVISSRSSSSTKSCRPKSINHSFGLTRTLEDRLYVFAQSLDLQKAWYVLHRPPDLPQSFDSSMLNQLSCTYSPEQASVVLQSLLHHCYHFANQASNFKYRPPSEHPADLTSEQGQCIAYLSQWLTYCDLGMLAWVRSSAQQQLRSLYLILRLQCLSTLIYVSTILNPYETTYDTHATYFEQIIQSASEVLQQLSPSSPTQPYCHFSIQPGLAQALFLTSMKHRHPTQRRSAISLLSMTGVEGPWNSRVLCKVARRAVEIEESRSSSTLLMGVGDYLPDTFRIPDNDAVGFEVPERHRLHGCGMDSEAGDMEANKPVMVNFSLCNDVDDMVRSSDFENPKHWSLWTEPVQLSHVNFS